MVIDWLLGIVESVLTTVLGWLPVVEAPAWLSTAGGWIATVGTYVEGTGVWIPWAVIAGVIAAWVVAMATMVTIKGVRIVASFLTLGGGSAA